MVLRKLRWLSAALLAAAAALAAPSRASADTQILIQEFAGSATSPLFSNVFSTSTAPGGGNPTYSPVGSSFNVTFVGATPFVQPNSTTLSTTVITTPTEAFNASHYLQVTVTSDGFANPSPGLPGTLSNDPGTTTSRLSDTNTNVGKTELFTGMIGSINPFVPPVSLTDTQTTGGADARSESVVPTVPGAFAIQQTLTIRIGPNGGSNGTFTDSLSSSLDTTPPSAVPAPAGLLLALAAVPVFGLRRALRRKTQA